MFTIIAGALVAGLAFASPQPAVDAGDALRAVQECTERATQQRIHAIDGVLMRLDRHDSITEPHRERAVERLTQNRDDMERIRREVGRKDNANEARGMCADVAKEHRVYAVTLPQVHYAAAADRLSERAIPRLEELYDSLSEAAQGDADAEEALEEFRTAIDEAKAAVDGVADAALDLDPEDFNADPTVMAEVRQDLREASEAVREAMHAARAVREAL